VILLVADGAGYNTWAATALYEGTSGTEFPAADGWVSAAVSAHALRNLPASPALGEQGLQQDPRVVYDPARAWDTATVRWGHGPGQQTLAGYKWLSETAPDSANTATAMITGRKTYVGAINVDGNGAPIEETLARLAKAAGRRVGLVSSVSFAHATPAAFSGSHNRNRENYCALAVEMLTSVDVDLIAGCGHPDYDNNGRRIEQGGWKSFRDVGGEEMWHHITGDRRLESGARVCSDYPVQERRLDGRMIELLDRWALKTSREEIDQLVEGSVPDHLLIIPRVGETPLASGPAGSPDHSVKVRYGGALQQQRGSLDDPRHTAPGDDPYLSTVPSLETLTRVALNALDDAADGFLLMVEGGAVDWAMHDLQFGRMVEELIDFKRAVDAAVAWVNSRQAWDSTLVLVTSDHDHLVWGPDSDKIPFQPLEDRGRGRLPGYRWLSNDHTNALVPVHARGLGADRLLDYADREDPVRGRYLDQTDLFELMRDVLTAN
jgi:alkaline phosphatase